MALLWKRGRAYLAHTMRKNIQEVAEKMKADERVRSSLAILSARLDDRYRTILEHTYFDNQLHDIYNAYREASRLNPSDTMRTLVKFPNAYVYHFLNDLFTSQYGKEWLTDKQLFLKVCKKEELLQPWLTVEKV